MKRGRSRRAVIGIFAVIIILAVVYALRMPVAKFALAKGMGAATGTSVSVGTLSMHDGHARLTGVTVSAVDGYRVV
jgi:hypothetical protein